MQRNNVTKVIRPLVAAAGLLLLAASVTCQIAFAQSSLATTTASNGDPARGQTLYQGCTDCHSIDKNDVGPKHRGVVGRHAGIIADYGYSKALKTSGLTWDEPTLDRWLTNPGALVPGTQMFYNVERPQDRADIIAYLKQQK
ncbi:MAG: cytochrome c family protein [Xanthobacteraceae bacterium]|nr:cytochrome c family protein [Xanthobacteraceae bacterium]